MALHKKGIASTTGQRGSCDRVPRKRQGGGKGDEAKRDKGFCQLHGLTSCLRGLSKVYFTGIAPALETVLSPFL